MQGFAAGVMLSLSFFDLLPEVVEAVGFEEAIAWVRFAFPGQCIVS